MTDKEVMQMALETAEQIASADYRHWGELASLGEFERWARSRANHIAEALRARLSQPEPEPEKSQDKPCVEDDGCPTEKAVLQRFWREHQAQPEQEPVGINKVIIDSIRDSSEIVAPPQREWVGLTDNEYELMAEKRVTNYFFNTLDYAHDIEAKLKEKNT